MYSLSVYSCLSSKASFVSQFGALFGNFSIMALTSLSGSNGNNTLFVFDSCVSRNYHNFCGGWSVELFKFSVLDFYYLDRSVVEVRTSGLNLIGVDFTKTFVGLTSSCLFNDFGRTYRKAYFTTSLRGSTGGRIVADSKKVF